MMCDTGASRTRQADPTLLRVTLFERMQAETLTGESVLPIGAKTRAILAILALSDRKPVLRSHISELLWSRRSEELARASLRQDIHRLLDALSPIGVDVIEVQRHTLTLKPALTSVDAERVLTANTRTLDALMPHNLDFLHELNGIDPAFDEWLGQQRDRIVSHVRAIYEARLQDSRDPDDLDRQARRLLAIDAYNDMAWRGRIRAAVLRGHESVARNLADMAVQTFGEDGQHVLSSATQALIDTLSRSASVGDREAAQIPDIDGDIAASPPLPEEMAAWAGTSGQRKAMDTHATVMVLAFENRSGPQDEALAAALRDLFELQFVGLAGIRVQSALHPGSVSDSVLLEASRTKGVNYLVAGSLQRIAGVQTIRLIVRVLDIRDGCAISAGTYRDLDECDPKAFLPPLADIAQCLKWDLLLAQARQIVHVPAAEWSSSDCVASAFLLLARRDRQFFPQVETLLRRARQDAPEHPLLPALECLFLYLRVVNDWTEAGDALVAPLSQARIAILTDGDFHFSRDIVIAFTMFFTPETQQQAKTLFEGLRRQDREESHAHTLGYRFCFIMDALLRGDTQTAVEEVEAMYGAQPRSPLHDLFEPLMMHVRLMGPNRAEVIATGRMLMALFPRFPAVLPPYLIALVLEGGDADEIAFVRDHMVRCAPSVTVERLVWRLSYFPPSHLARIEDALTRGGIPRQQVP